MYNFSFNFNNFVQYISRESKPTLNQNTLSELQRKIKQTDTGGKLKF